MAFSEGDPLQLSIFALPEPEWSGGYAISNGLTELSSYIDQFSAAVELFEWSQTKERIAHEEWKRATEWPKTMISPEAQHHKSQSRMLMNWAFIAARDGAMIIYHFGKAMDGITTSLTHHSPTLKAMVDMKKCRAAKDLFKEYFSDAEAIRHIVAHSAELTKTRGKVVENASTGNSFGQFINNPQGLKIMTKGSIMGNRYVGSHGGNDRSYEISAVSVAKLAEIKTAFFSAFNEAENSLREMVYERQRAARTAAKSDGQERSD